MRRVIAIVISIMVVSVCSASTTEFVNNGTFEGVFVPSGTSHALDGWADAVPVGWTRFETFSGGAVENSIIGMFSGSGPSAPGSWATLCWRPNGGSSGDWTTVQQSLSINAADYTSLALSLDTIVYNHDLEAGGWVSPAFEWPVAMRVWAASLQWNT